MTQEMVALLASGKVKASGIIATTFTNKAAAELQERVRVKLLEDGLSNEANDLANALIGTVHGLGVKLLKRFAFEAGVSPELDIIADEDQQFMFNQSLSVVLTNRRVQEMEELSSRLGLNKSDRYKTDWRKILKDLTEIARANNFSKQTLDKSKQLSFSTFCQFLDKEKNRPAEEWNALLAKELEEAITRLDNNEDTTKVTANGVKALRELKGELKFRGELYWHQWVKLTKIKVGAKSRDDMAPLSEFANEHLGHAGLREDLKAFIFNIFDLSQKAIEEYSRYKKSRGLIDYTDMEVLVNQLLDEPLVLGILQEEIDLLMVDEFQDTSPIQLEIFLKLSKIAKHSIWVGDPKQSIYGFRGAEPALMNAIIEQQGGLKKENILAYSWRSREDIVNATNAIFTRAFSEMPVEQVALKPKRCQQATGDSSNTENEPAEVGKALVHWHFQYDGEGRKPGKAWLNPCIAESVRTLLERGPSILPKACPDPSGGGNGCRKIRPGDIAILCRSNRNCLDMADALHRAGLKAAISRAGLLGTTEARLVLACLKFILNKYDSLSIAEIMLLAADLKIEEIIEDRLAHLGQKEEGAPDARWGEGNAFIGQLNELRPRVVELSSAEILTLLLEELDLRRIIVSWGNVEQRLANIDVFIKLSLQYEEACNRLHTAASLGGFLLWLHELENNEKDMQGAGENPQAVNVLTYHKSKGLEYPVVICHSLDQPLRDDVWGLTIVPEKEEVDLDNLLGNRWLRMWVNPYADQFRNTKLAERIDGSEAKKEKRKAALKEEARLLYVGITRARDYLVFPTFHKQPLWFNRVYNNGKEEVPVLDASSDLSPWEWEGEMMALDTEVFYYPADFGHCEAEQEDVFILEKPSGRVGHLPFSVDKLEVAGGLDLEESNYHSPLSLPEVAERQLVGKAIVSYLNSYKNEIRKDGLLEMAGRLILLQKVEDLVEADQVLQLSAAFDTWIENEFEVKNILQNFPLSTHFDGQFFETKIDLLLETAGGFQIILHSNFVGEQKARLKKTREMAGELAAMKGAVRAFFGVVSVGVFLNFVLYGTVVKVEI